MTDLFELRRRLHREPELSGNEENTAAFIGELLDSLKPDRVLRGLGGHGLAAVFKGRDDGPRVLVRCELDALPIDETTDIPHASRHRGVAHKCGHDGHMVIVVGLARRLHETPPSRGEVVLLFQPAEETGAGGELVINDPQFEAIRPDYALALHNLPGYPKGQVVVRDGCFASASTGIHINLQGATSHAAEPEAGNSPALAMAQLISAISALPQNHTALHEAAKATVIHARLGEVAFGTSPGEADVMATLRSHSQPVMDTLVAHVIELAESAATAFKLKVRTRLVEPFPTTVNAPEVVTFVRKAAAQLGLSIHERAVPFAWSEDFGHFTSLCKGALFGLGSGEEQPALHHPDYDFPDDIIDAGVNILHETVKAATD